MQNIWGRGEVYTGFWWGHVRGREHLEDPEINGRTVVKWTLEIGMVEHELD